MSDRYEFTTDADRLDTRVVHRFLSTSYWAAGVDEATVRRSIAGSLCFGFLEDGATVAFARVVTDGATFAWLADVFVVPEHRGRGLGKRLVRRIVDDPRLGSLRRWVLCTRDAHGLYRRYGFEPVAAPDRWMERVAADGIGDS